MFRGPNILQDNNERVASTSDSREFSFIIIETNEQTNKQTNKQK